MRAKAMALIMLGTITGSQLVCADNLQGEQAALTAANKWLAIVDSGQFAKSYDESARLFQSRVTKDRWLRQIKAGRPLFGKVIKRTLEAEQFTTTMPGAPDGEYVVIQFDTEFEKKKQAIETITPMKEQNGTWRVSGYFVR
jgi:Protein of unknown function (DUF4019)